MPTKNTRDREEAKKSNVVLPTNPLMPYDIAVYKKLKRLYDEVYYVDTYENAFKMNAKAHQGKHAARTPRDAARAALQAPAGVPLQSRQHFAVRT